MTYFGKFVITLTDGNKPLSDMLNLSLSAKFLPDIALSYQKLNSKLDVLCIAGLCEEICSTFKKICVCCEEGNYILAFLSDVCL